MESISHHSSGWPWTPEYQAYSSLPDAETTDTNHQALWHFKDLFLFIYFFIIYAHVHVAVKARRE